MLVGGRGGRGSFTKGCKPHDILLLKLATCTTPDFFFRKGYLVSQNLNSDTLLLQVLVPENKDFSDKNSKSD